MLRVLAERWHQKMRTIDFPRTHPPLSDRYQGRPLLAPERCPGAGCEACTAVCPTGAVGVDGQGLFLDLGRCLFCGACVRACPHGAVTFGQDFRMAARRREDLILRGASVPEITPLEEERRRLFARSLRLRQVSAGGCMACEADLNVLTTVVFDLGRFGIDFVASPRHGDGVAVTGPVTRNMRDALLWTHAASPDPRVSVAVGACAISGGIYAGLPETSSGATELLPVDLFIPGCPPHPLTILHGLLGLIGRLS